MLSQVIRFGSIGVLATLTHVFVALAAESLSSATDQQANLAGFMVAVLVSYAGHSLVTFQAPLVAGPQFLKFIISALLGLGASSLTVHIVTGVLGFSFTWAMVAIVVTVPAVTFLAMRFWVFSGRDATGAVPIPDLAMCAALALATMLVFWDRLVNHDIAWYLFAARDWMAGAELYVDLMEVNPPLYFYYTRFALMIGDLLGLGDAHAHVLTVSLLLFTTLVWSSAILRADFALTLQERMLLLVGITLAAVIPTLDGYGQREQILVLCMLPWVLREASPRRPTPSQSVTTAIFAGFGMCLKPHFVFLPLAVTLLNCLEHRSFRPVLSVSNLVFGVMGLAYVGYVLWIHPTYLTQVVPIAMEVYDAFAASMRTVLLRVGYVVISMAALVLVLIRQGSFDRQQRVLMAVAMGGLASYLTQGTGFSYHKAPVLAFSAIACFLVLLRPVRTRQVTMLAVLVLAAFAVSGSGRGFYRNAAVPAAQTVVAKLGPIEGVMVLSSNIKVGPPVALALGLDWSSTYPHNWLVPGAINRLEATDCISMPDTCDMLRGIAARNRSANIDDIERLAPDLLILDRKSDQFNEPEFDWPAFMAVDPRWASIFGQYREVAANKRFTYLLRNAD